MAIWQSGHIKIDTFISYEKFSLYHHQESLTTKKIPLLESLGPSHSSLPKQNQHKVVCLNNNRSQQWANHWMKLSGWLLTILNTLLLPFLSDPAFPLDLVSDADAKPSVNLSIHQTHLFVHSFFYSCIIPYLHLCDTPLSVSQIILLFSGNLGAPRGPFSYHVYRGKPLSGSFRTPVAIVLPCGPVCGSLDLGEGGHSSILAPFLPVTWSSSSGYTLSPLMPCFRGPGEKVFGSLYV